MTSREERILNELKNGYKKDIRKISAFESIMSAIYGIGPLPVGWEKGKFRIKKFIQMSKGK